MADLDTTLAAIDAVAVQECGGCGRPLKENGPSPYYCSETCQSRWAAHRSNPLPDDDFPGLSRGPGARRPPDTRAPIAVVGEHGPELINLPVNVRGPNRDRHEIEWAQVTGDTPPLIVPGIAGVVIERHRLEVMIDRTPTHVVIHAKHTQPRDPSGLGAHTYPVELGTPTAFLVDVSAEQFAIGILNVLRRNNPPALTPDTIYEVVYGMLVEAAHQAELAAARARYATGVQADPAVQQTNLRQLRGGDT
ncbi:zinc finger MYND domain-containing protein [Labedaea rhizosphaerae]|uniref:Uncharacterized protein n=1 Tax=Labedaea rhizosphaerae TaxID=598644 RepID=A0A4V3CZD8_LABRH|nr:zinc finger MYND domain-containing protein [Labedaea rhizosphaerae]TDP97658.1 hypothetical protein EV186_103622 [Labedaea rhizosphaerae]